MPTHQFVAYSLAKEFDLNKMAANLGMNRKYRWEEPMILTARDFPGVISEEMEHKYIYLFSFGCAVFINCSDVEVKKVIEELNFRIPGPENYLTTTFIDTYSLQITEGQNQKITNDYAIIPEFRRNLIDMISIVIAKSVALERIEKVMEGVFDEVDEIVQLLERGKLRLDDKRIARLTAKVLNINLSTLSYIMVLDKPDFTWYNILADQFYIELAGIFELIDRYEDVKHKSEVLKETIDAFANLTHAERATRQELAVIYLIAFEILMSLYELTHTYIINFIKHLFH